MTNITVKHDPWVSISNWSKISLANRRATRLFLPSNGYCLYPTICCNGDIWMAGDTLCFAFPIAWLFPSWLWATICLGAGTSWGKGVVTVGWLGMSQKKRRRKDLINIQVLTYIIGLSTKAMVLQLGYGFNKGFSKYVSSSGHIIHQDWVIWVTELSP